jgi:hypothetical protein
LLRKLNGVVKPALYFLELAIAGNIGGDVGFREGSWNVSYVVM